MIKFKIKLATRNLLKNKLYSFLIIGGFAIGFTGSILIALYYNAEHNIDKHFARHKNIYRLFDANKNESGLDYKISAVLSEKYPDIEKVCPLGLSYYPITIKDSETLDYTRINYMVTTDNQFFDVFSVPVLSGLEDNPFSQLSSAVITESLAKRLFGERNPLGRIVKIGDRDLMATVTAVIKDLPDNSSFKAELLLNGENEKFRMAQSCNNGVCINPVEHFILLQNEIEPDDFTERLNASIGQFNTTTDSLALQPLSDIYLSSERLGWTDNHTKGNSKMLFIFLAIAVLIILLSSINYLNYTVSMQYAKMKEIGINKTSGAGKSHLLVDSFMEVTLGIFLALVVSVVLVSLLLPLSEALFGREIQFSDVNFHRLLPAFVAIIVGIIFLNSLAPIYILSKFNITDFLAGGRKRTGKQFGKQMMLTFQLTVSIVLIAVVTLIFKQLEHVKHYELGFNKEHLLRIEVPWFFENQKALRNEITDLPFVSASTMSNGYPGNINMTMGSGVEDDQFVVKCFFVTDDFLETMGLHLLDGRNFLVSDKGTTCLMNETAINRYGWESIEGKIYNNGREGGFKVVGKVNDFNVESLHSELTPVVLLYDPDMDFNALSIRLIPGNLAQQISEIRKVWDSMLPDDPMEFTFYDDQFQAMYEKEDKLGRSISFFSIIAIVLTAMGILGQIFLVSLHRTKEIGIRKVNGAKVSEILSMLNKDFIKWVAIAFVIATPIAYYAMNKWLENFAYKTNLSWWIFALAGLLALGIALLTVSFQSYKAATRNPIESLRYE